MFHQVTKKPIYIETRGLRPIFDQGPPRTIYGFLGTLAHLVSGPHHFVFWGFGIAPPEGPSRHGCCPIPRELDIEVRALRGPLTRKVLVARGYTVAKSLPYGDPALLAPCFYKPSSYKVNDFCIVPHHTMYGQWRERFRGMNVIDIRVESYESLQGLIAELTKYRAIFSSSLHVTILAELFGIPTRPLAPTLPFKFEDFYAAVNKKVQYLPEPSLDSDWASLYQETIESWQPIRWDPMPWLDTSPFAIPRRQKETLLRHYVALAGRRAADVAQPSARLPRKVGASYGRLQKASGAKQNDRSSPRPKEELVWKDGFASRLRNWFVVRNPKPPKNRIRKTRQGCQLQVLSDGPYVASPFLKIGSVVEIRVSLELHAAEGVAAVFVQDENYETMGQLTIGPDSKPGEYEILVWPTREELRLRVVVMGLRGKIVVGSVKVFRLPKAHRSKTSKGSLP